jgi:hypothetical protein
LARILRQAKHNKALETSGGIGLAVDGTTVGRCATSGCLRALRAESQDRLR